MKTKTIFRKLITLICVAAPLTLAGCGGGGGAGSSTPPPNTIAGKVSMQGGGLGQVSLSITGGASDFSDANGNFSFGSLPDGTYTVTPSRYGYSFTPASRTVTIANSGAYVEFEAAPIVSYSVTGKVSSANGAGVAGVTVKAVAAGTSTVAGSQVTDGEGNYAIGGLESGQYVVTPSSASGYSFTPASQSVTVNTANVASVNFAAPSVSTFAVSGNIKNGSGAAVANVSITVTPLTITGEPVAGITYISATDNNGNYAYTGLADGYYRITPTLKDYAFGPDPALVIQINGGNISGNNFIATPVTTGGGSINIQF